MEGSYRPFETGPPFGPVPASEYISVRIGEGVKQMRISAEGATIPAVAVTKSS